jgi:hypothetical protein
METFLENVGNKLIDFFGATDTWRMVIHTDAPVAATDNALADWTEIGNSNGYTTGGENITYNSTRSGGTITATATDFAWTASGGNLGASTTGRYFGIYDDTSAGNNVMADFDYGATFTVAAGETMTADFGASLNTWV